MIPEYVLFGLDIVSVVLVFVLIIILFKRINKAFILSLVLLFLVLIVDSIFVLRDYLWYLEYTNELALIPLYALVVLVCSLILE